MLWKAVGRVSMSQGSTPSRLDWTRFLTTVAKSSSNVRKLCAPRAGAEAAAGTPAGLTQSLCDALQRAVQPSKIGGKRCSTAESSFRVSCQARLWAEMFRRGDFFAFLSGWRGSVGGSPSVRSCGGLQWAGGRLGLPEAILAEQGIEQADELAHDGDEDDLVRLAAGREAFVKGLGGGFAADRGEGGHVQQLARMGAAAANGAAAAVLSGVAVEGGEAEEGGGPGRHGHGQSAMLHHPPQAVQDRRRDPHHHAQGVAVAFLRPPLPAPLCDRAAQSAGPPACAAAGVLNRLCPLIVGLPPA